MSPLTFSIAASLQEELWQANPMMKLAVVEIIFLFLGVMTWFIKLSDEPEIKGGRSSLFQFNELCKICAWFIMIPFITVLAIITIVLPIGLIGLVLFGIIKAIKSAWFF